MLGININKFEMRDKREADALQLFGTTTPIISYQCPYWWGLWELQSKTSEGHWLAYSKETLELLLFNKYLANL